MISTNTLHKKLAQLLGDIVTPEGAEINAGEDGVRYTYEIRKSALEFAIGQIIINTNDNAVLNQFLNQQIINLVSYNRIGDVHRYLFTIPQSVLRFDRVYIENTSTNESRILYSGFPFHSLYGIGLGIYYVEGNNLIVLLPYIFHTNLSDIKARILYYSSDGWGEINKTLQLPSFYEEIILNTAYLNIINREVVKK